MPRDLWLKSRGHGGLKMKQDDPMIATDLATIEKLGPKVDASAASSSAKRPFALKNLLLKIACLGDSVSEYQRGAQAVTISSGVGMVAGLALGWPVWAGYLVGTLPAYLVCAVVYMSRA